MMLDEKSDISTSVRQQRKTFFRDESFRNIELHHRNESLDLYHTRDSTMHSTAEELRSLI